MQTKGGMNSSFAESARSDVLYPSIRPFDSGFLCTEGGHSVYWEMCGNPRGLPVLFLHGGPGGGCSENSRRFFDPARYRIILFDQRGCGRSTPAGSLNANTTAHLLDDIEQLRKTLGVSSWVLFGGSWGATLALAYAQQYPDKVSAIVLRAVFAARQSELDWLYRDGASRMFPEAWARFNAFIPPRERADIIAAFHQRVTSGDEAIEAAAARTWCLWEDAIATLLPSPMVAEAGQLRSLARIETHYFVHQCFMAEGQLLANANRLRGIPGVIVQGRYDAVTPPITACDLHDAWPDAALTIVPDAGHAASEPGIMRRLIAATNTLATG